MVTNCPQQDDLLARATADTALSHVARGVIVLAVACGTPGLKPADLVASGLSDREARRVLQELKEAGYLEFVREQDAAGKFTDAVYHVRKNAEMDADHPRKNDHVVKNADMAEGSHVRKNAEMDDHVRKNAEMVQATRARGGATESCLEESDSTRQDKNKKQIQESTAAAAVDSPARAREERAAAAAELNIFELFHDTFARTVNSPVQAGDLADIAASFPADWIRDAFHEAGLAGAKNQKYVRAILNRWERDGRDSPSASQPPKPVAQPRASPARASPPKSHSRVSPLPPLGEAAPPPFLSASKAKAGKS